eukprot:CAMPEP_0185729294 /NCGR_PEP_ID=MMETSP1171-20130828/5075_1 /TAXON_ID=374046 /ORGANISM="Helicotheca tamensis, Strain CCMP826" /LENGTH=402 /DNA_ID=CAMNT_0028398093 /DNA_START=64 /DNA_END=1272 /DNA_ORIENTATION=-
MSLALVAFVVIGLCAPNPALSFVQRPNFITPLQHQHFYSTTRTAKPLSSTSLFTSVKADSTVQTDVSELQKLGFKQEANKWIWEGYEIHNEVTKSNDGKDLGPVLLIHGFGCSTRYWRETVKTLANSGYTVYAIDLLGLGQSAKPSEVYYSINLWARMIDDYVQDIIAGKGGHDEGVVLIGNSIGSIIALAAAAGDHLDDPESTGFLCEDERVRGICMFNAAVGLNSRGVANEPQWNPFQRALIRFTLSIFDILIFKNRLLLEYILNEVVTEDLLSSSLRALYKHNPDRVDDELVQSFLQPAKQEGAVDALGQIYTNDPGATPMELHEMYPEKLDRIPLKLVWGDQDEVAPVTGGVGSYYIDRANDIKYSNCNIEVVKAGHVPFDDNPEDSNGALMKWLAEV